MALSFSLFLLFLSSYLPVLAQQQDIIKDIVEQIAPDLPEDVDLSELIEQLQYFSKNQINLNQTSAEELKLLVILSPLQISNFFSHLSANGKLLDLLELQQIAGFDVQTIQNLLPFVTLKTPSGYRHLNFKNLLIKGNNDLILRYAQTLEEQKGFPGSAWKPVPGQPGETACQIPLSI